MTLPANETKILCTTGLAAQPRDEENLSEKMNRSFS